MGRWEEREGGRVARRRFRRVLKFDWGVTAEKIV